MYSTSRSQRWASILLGYNFTEFGQADALSRLINSQRSPEDDTVIAAINVDGYLQRTMTMSGHTANSSEYKT